MKAQYLPLQLNNITTALRVLRFSTRHVASPQSPRSLLKTARATAFSALNSCEFVSWPMITAMAASLYTSFDLEGRFCQKFRRHSWPEAVQSLRPSISGIFDPLPDPEETDLRSSMTLMSFPQKRPQ